MSVVNNPDLSYTERDVFWPEDGIDADLGLIPPAYDFESGGPLVVPSWTDGVVHAQVRFSAGSTGDGHGFWPPNVVLSHSARCEAARCDPTCPAAMIDQVARRSLSRAFYVARASRGEREAGLASCPKRYSPIFSSHSQGSRARSNFAPCVKPIELMRWLIRLGVPVGGLVVDPFAGSGSTGCAAMMEHRQFLGIEREAEYVQIARARLAHWAERGWAR